MKTNAIQLTLAAVAASTVGLLAATTIVVTVGYLAVLLLIAVAVVDYRQSPRSYASR
jgi:heme/copper-type cytochrome/quinol oxidase subunit 2